jgi:RNA polymerase sigma-70 factor, ECF subfamily
MDTDVERIVREFQKQRQNLLSYIRALTCDADCAEDLIQEISVIVLRMANAGERPDNLPAWCRGIARNLLLRERRDMRRLVYIDSTEWIELVDRTFEENATSVEELRRSSLRQCMDKLGAQARDLIDLRYSRSLRLRDIAERMNKSELAVQVALSRLRKTLKDCIQRQSARIESRQ